jgi:hypothetical protein
MFTLRHLKVLCKELVRPLWSGKGESIIRNPGKSNDDIAGLNVIKALGATVNSNENGSLAGFK